MTLPLKRLAQILGYEIKDPKFLKQALTHCSVSSDNNERLEFLGDSILNFVIAHALFNKFPHKTEGELSRLRAYLVAGEMLAQIALKIDLGSYLFLGQGELKSGGFRRESILADALEAVFAAIFKDSGFPLVEATILKLYAPLITEDILTKNVKDFKTQLQELMQAHKLNLPIYEVKSVHGQEHNQTFSIYCKLDSLNIIELGQGSTRRKTEQAAAEKALLKAKQQLIKPPTD